MTQTKSSFLNILYSELLHKTREYHANIFFSNPGFSNNFDVDITKDSFGRDFKAHIEEVIHIKNPLNHRTLINILKGGFALNAQKNTLNNFSLFLGYNDFDDFCLQKTQRYETLQNIPPDRFKNKLILGLSLGLIALFLTIIIFWHYNSYKATDKEMIIKTIKMANKAQYNTFKYLPNLKIAALEKYYIKGSSAYNLIIHLLNKQKNKRLVISYPSDNPSYFTIHSVKVIDLQKDYALAESSEHWYLKWYSLEKNKYELKYDVGNKQTYILKKIEGVWKIESNDYLGESKQINE